MGRIGIFYGSSSGNTEAIARRIQQAFGADSADVVDISKASVAQMNEYSYLVLGTSTWGLGDLQDDWAGFESQLSKLSWAGKKVALFGLGDSSSYSDTFVDGMGIIYEAIQDKAAIVGKVSTEGYSYETSKAEVGGEFVGLPLDEDNESNKTGSRLDAWLVALKNEFV